MFFWNPYESIELIKIQVRLFKSIIKQLKINRMKLELELHELPLDKDGFVNFEMLKCDINDFIILVDEKTNDIQIICEATKCNDFKIKREYATHYASINDFSKREKITFKKGDISKSR